MPLVNQRYDQEKHNQVCLIQNFMNWYQIPTYLKENQVCYLFHKFS